ncbi:MAG: hypothetical protein ACI4HZ_01195 [Ruminococcus sp.]
MRALTFKGYLLMELQNLSGLNSRSLYAFSRLASSNARLKDALCLYLVLYTDKKLKNKILKKFEYLKCSCKDLDGLYEENISDYLQNDSLSHYRTVYSNYLYMRNRKSYENKMIGVMYKKIYEEKQHKGVTNYRIYKALNLNPGNANAFLKYGDTSKVSLDTARRILSFVNEY